LTRMRYATKSVFSAAIRGSSIPMTALLLTIEVHLKFKENEYV